MECTKLKTDTF